MLSQIVVIFRISLQLTDIFGYSMGFNPFSQGDSFSPSFFLLQVIDEIVFLFSQKT